MTFASASFILRRVLVERVESQVSRPVTVDRAVVELAMMFAHRFARRAQDAEDIAQEALLRLLRNGDAVSSPVAWLFVVIRRLAITHGRLAEEPLPDPAPSIDPWPEVQLSIDARRLLTRLAPRARKALRLSLAGYSEAETALRLGCSVKATEKALHRGRCDARRLLSAG